LTDQVASWAVTFSVKDVPGSRWAGPCR